MQKRLASVVAVLVVACSGLAWRWAAALRWVQKVIFDFYVVSEKAACEKGH